MLRSCVLMLASGLSAPVLALDQYLCVAEQSTGFKFSGGRWAPVSFLVDKDRYLFQEIKVEDFTPRRFVVKRIGDESTLPGLDCKYEVYPTRIECGDSDLRTRLAMLLHIDSLRFQALEALSFIDRIEKPGSTLSLTIGSCTKLGG
jgi:hypothetical protein